MKRIRMLALMLFFVITLAGCARQQTTQETMPAAPVTVDNVDDLLAAIAPGAEIILAEGSYVLSDASDYGAAAETEYYFWEELGDGWQLVIQNVSDLIIRGSGREKTVLYSQFHNGDVLMLRGCSNVTLQDCAVENPEEGEYGGLSLLYCNDVSLKGLLVSGCGTEGILLESCVNVTLSDSRIQKCGFMGLQAVQVNGLQVENCAFRELGNTEYGGSSVFRLHNSQNVTVSGCEISQNQVTALIDCYPCDNITFGNNAFTGNRIQGAALDVDSGLYFVNNVVEDNVIPAWFPSDRTTILDGIGKTWTEEMLQRYYHPPVESVPEGEQTQVHAATVDELLAAIGPNTEIILEADFYDFSTATDYGTGYTDYYYWTEEFDGPNLVITDVENLTIRSEDGDVKGCTLSAVPRYAHVLSFRHCSGITLSGFTAGHTVEPGYCMGGVLNFYDCDNILVDHCGLYGCGILGVQAERSGMITVKNCDIYECSYGGIQMSEVTGVVIEKCTFRDLGGDSMAFFDCRDVTVNGKKMSGNTRIR